jgi:hypothetical protein
MLGALRPGGAFRPDYRAVSRADDEEDEEESLIAHASPAASTPRPLATPAGRGGGLRGLQRWAQQSQSRRPGYSEIFLDPADET